LKFESNEITLEGIPCVFEDSPLINSSTTKVSEVEILICSIFASQSSTIPEAEFEVIFLQQ
jgi:hypothetical protein